jgi:hypothetical protein
MNTCNVKLKSGELCNRESGKCRYHTSLDVESSEDEYISDEEDLQSPKVNMDSIMEVMNKKTSPKKVETNIVGTKGSKVFRFKNYRDYKEHRQKIVKIDFDLDEFLATSEINPKNRTAIIVPYRDTPDKVRSAQMKVFLEHYHDFLPHVKIYIVEQSDFKKKFNLGKLVNIGFKLAKKDGAQVYIKHDIDLISPKEMAPLYNLIPDHPVHIGGLWREKYTFEDFFGGIVSYNSKDYEKSNGFPNNAFGWGSDDDIQYNRLVINDIPIYIPHSKNLKIKGLEHESMSDNPETKNLNKQDNILKDFKFWEKNGVNNVKFKLLKIKKTDYKNAKIYTVDIN